MGIQQVTKLATNLLQNVKKLPVKQVCLAGGLGIFGTGLLIGKALWGDSFEKEQVETLQHQKDSLTQVNATMSEELKAIKEQLEADAEKEKNKFKYEPPVGEGIVADTTGRHLVNGSPVAEITYLKNGRPYEIASYDREGNFKGYRVVFDEKDGVTYVAYDENGKFKYMNEFRYDGTDITTYDDARYTHKKGKTIVENFDSYVSPGNKTKEEVYSDSNYEHLVQEKHYKDGLLQYTVTPKYNKDGDLIQRDTTWVNK